MTDARVTRHVAGQVARFRIYPQRGRSRLFYTVRVFDTIGHLHRFVRGSRSTASNTSRGFCRTFTRQYLSRGRWRTSAELGDILLVTSHLGTGVITHELTHAMFGWANRKRLVDLQERRVANSPKMHRGTHHKDSVEEQCCYALGEMARDLVTQLYKRKLLR
jgi:hypothetical protein